MKRMFEGLFALMFLTCQANAQIVTVEPAEPELKNFSENQLDWIENLTPERINLFRCIEAFGEASCWRLYSKITLVGLNRCKHISNLECASPISQKIPSTVGMKVKIWFAIRTPGEFNEAVRVDIKWYHGHEKDPVRVTTLRIEQASLRFRSNDSFTPEQPGEWEIVIENNGNELGKMHLTVQPAVEPVEITTSP